MAEAKQFPQYVVSACVCIGAMGFGTCLAWSSNITEELKKGELNGFKMDDEKLGWAGSSLCLGSMITCFPTGWIADKIGRKPTVLICTVPFIIGWLFITFGNNMGYICTGRFLIGVGGGSFCVMAPVYISEIAQKEIRGRLGSFFQLFLTVGALYSGILGYALPMMLHNFSCLAVPVVLAILFIFQPESPFYDLKKGRQEKADKSFDRLRGKEYDHSGEMRAMMTDIENEKKLLNFREAMKSKASKRATIICFVLMFFQQFGGINAIMFYLQEIFHSSGSTLKDSYCTIIVLAIQVIFTLIAALVIDRFGRKFLLILSAALMSFSTGMLGLFFSLKERSGMDEDGMRKIGFIPLLSLNIYMIAFSLGIGPVPWVSVGEILSPDIKTKCGPAAASFCSLSTFVVTKFFFTCSNAFGTDSPFYIFSIVSFCAVFFVWFYVPETKGKTFQEITEILGS